MHAIFLYGQAFEDAGITLVNRIVGRTNTPITRASISSIALSIYECADQSAAERAVGTIVGSAQALDKNVVVYDTLQLDDRWKKKDGTYKDSVGYNFAFDSVAADRPTGGKWHRFEFVFTMASGAPLVVVWLVESLPLAAS